MKETQDCPYLIDASYGITKMGKCQLTNDICGFMRFCTTKNKIVSSELFFISGCNIKNYNDEKENK
jgi:hypothetical protein